MSLPSLESTKYQEQIETILEGSPENQDAKLQGLSSKLEAFVESGHIEQAELMIGLLGTAVGRDKTWQTSYRENGILAFVLKQLLDLDTALELNKQCLRVIGNSVADNDMNREIVTTSLAKLIACISTDGLMTIALIVLFNLCNDFDPAKAASAALRLDATIIKPLANDELPEAALDYAVELLTWTTENLTAAQLKDTDSLNVYEHLLHVVTQYDEDHYHEFVAILVHYLQDPDFQTLAAIPESLDSLVGLALDFEARIMSQETEAVFQELSITKTDEASAPESINVMLLAQLINSVSAVAATDAFLKNFDIRSPVIERMRAILRSSEESPCKVCACVMLGNLAMSDTICIDMVNIMEFHITLISILSSSKHPALLFAAAGFMRHLSFPEVNRSQLANAGLLQTCSRLLKLEDPAVRGEAAAILCKLVTNNFHNIEKVVYNRVEAALATADTAADSTSTGSTILERVVEQALSPSKPLPSTAMKNAMIELGRTIVAVLRHLGRPNAEKDTGAVRKVVFAVPRVARPVARLLQQRFYADARSEGLLGLGLFAQSPEGALCVTEEIEEDSKLLEGIKELASGEGGGAEQQQSTEGKNLQNTMVLLQALQNNAGPSMNAGLKAQITTLQESIGHWM